MNKMDIQKVKELALANGFKLKEQADGSMDLNMLAAATLIGMSITKFRDVVTGSKGLNGESEND